jgi:hypothetical protein
MSININNRNNRYLILLCMVSIFSAIVVFLASYENIQQSVFANSQVTMKDQINNMKGMQNQNMVMNPSQMQPMVQPMNKTGMMMGEQQWPMMGMESMIMQPMNQTGMMGMGQGMAIPCKMMTMMMIGNQTIVSMAPCMMMNQTGMMGMGPMMTDPSQMQPMMQPMNKTDMMMKPMNN